MPSPWPCGGDCPGVSGGDSSMGTGVFMRAANVMFLASETKILSAKMASCWTVYPSVVKFVRPLPRVPAKVRLAVAPAAPATHPAMG
eukprot:12634353-Heterocapsa_arctica.AAC.1